MTQTRKIQHVILVDDDADDREVFSEAMAFVDPHAGLTMKRDGEELMEHLVKDEPLPDLIFLDLNMPRKNGKECLYEIRHVSRLKHIPIIIYTTSLNPLDIEETYSFGANRFFRKPNSFEDLKHILHHILFTKMVNDQCKREDFVLALNHKPVNV